MFDWTKYSSDPNHFSIYPDWKDYYNGISKFVFRYRNDFLYSYLGEFNKILDIGFVEHTLDYINNPKWFHGNLRQRFPDKEIWGLDTNAELVEFCTTQFGFDNLVCGDACAFPLKENYFDVIHVGHVIEHVSDIGRFMQFCYGSLRSGGKLVVSTPNPFGRSFSQWRSKLNLVPVNMEHSCWITPSCMNELCRRHHFTFEQSIYPKPLGTKFRSLRAFLFGLWQSYRFTTRDSYYDEYIYILTKP